MASVQSCLLECKTAASASASKAREAEVGAADTMVIRPSLKKCLAVLQEVAEAQRGAGSITCS